MNLHGNGLRQPLYSDPRNIPLSAAEAVTEAANAHFADISTLVTNDQGQTGSCVGQAVAKMKEYQEYIEDSGTLDFSARGAYALAKKIDNMSGWGTTLQAGVKVANLYGVFRKDKYIPENTQLPDTEFRDWTIIPQSAYQEGRNFKTKGYAYVYRGDLEAIKSALVTHGVLIGGVNMSNEGMRVDGQDPKIRVPAGSEKVYGHAVMFYGYEPHPGGGTRLWFQNSWGQGWGSQGRGYLVYEEYPIFDMWLSLDLPSELLADAKRMIPLIRGDSRPEVFAHNTKHNTKAWINREALLNWRGLLWPDKSLEELMNTYVQVIPQGDMDNIRQTSVIIDTIEL